MKKNKIILIDDEVNVLNSLQRILRSKEYDVETTTQPDELFDHLKKEPYSVVISDQRMPTMEGTEVLKKVKELYPKTMRIMLTGYADMQAAIKAVNEGSIFRFMAKPWNEDELKGAIAQAIEYYNLSSENETLLKTTQEQNTILSNWNDSLEKKIAERTEKVERLNQRLEKSFFESVKLLGAVGEMSNHIIGGHSRRVAKLSVELGKTLKLSSKDLFQLQVAAFLHDIGKIGLKSSTQPNAEDIRIHPERGAHIINQVHDLKPAALYIKHHHENYDGSGYPDGLSGENIPLGSRIISLIDHYDKVLNFKKGYEDKTPKKVIEELILYGGIKFDLQLVNCFAQVMQAEVDKDQSAYEMEISLYELRENMILARPLQTKSGRVMLSSDFKLTKDILDRIWRHNLNDPLVTEVCIYKRSA